MTSSEGSSNRRRVPIAIFHGNNASASDLFREATILANALDTYAESVEYVTALQTLHLSLELQVKSACSLLRAHPIFGRTKEIDLIGHSNGGVIARWIAQNTKQCFGRDDVTVRHYISIGSPQNGVAAVPDVPMILSAGLFMLGAAQMCGWRAVNDLCGSTAYIYDPRNLEDDVRVNNGESFVNRINRGKCEFRDKLAGRRTFDGPLTLEASSEKINSDIDSNVLHPRWSHVRDRNTLAGRNGITGSTLLVLFEKDETVRPKESAWFARVVGARTFTVNSCGGPTQDVLRELPDTSVWKTDSIGLKQLHSEDRLWFYASPEKHDRLKDTEVEDVLAEFLAQALEQEENAEISENECVFANSEKLRVEKKIMGRENEVEMKILSRIGVQA